MTDLQQLAIGWRRSAQLLDAMAEKLKDIEAMPLKTSAHTLRECACALGDAMSHSTGVNGTAARKPS